MATINFLRGTTEEINATPIVDGNLLFDTDKNVIYMDEGQTRKSYTPDRNAPNTTGYADFNDYWANAIKVGANTKYTTATNRQGFYDMGLQPNTSNNHIIMLKLSSGFEGWIIARNQNNEDKVIRIRFMHAGVLSDWFELVDLNKTIPTTASELPFVPTSSISSNNVQSAITELDSKTNRFTTFDLNGGTATIGNGYYMAIAMKNTSSSPKIAGMTLIRITGGALNYQVPFNSDGFANITYSYSNGVLSTTGANNGNVCIIKLD